MSPTTKYDHGQPSMRPLVFFLIAAFALIAWMAGKGLGRAVELATAHHAQNLQAVSYTDLY